MSFRVDRRDLVSAQHESKTALLTVARGLMNTHLRKMPAQRQNRQPGDERAMHPQPITIADEYFGSSKLRGKTALISGGDSGIGRAVAVHFAREGANVAIIYLDECQDARDTVALLEEEGADSLLLQGDVSDLGFCEQAIRRTIDRFGSLHVLVNNAAEQHPADELADIDPQQVEKTFQTNVFGYFFLTQAALKHLSKGAAIVNTGSVTGFRGSKRLLDYAATKGAIQAFTYSLAQQLVDRGIRVNGVAPGPVWTPLIPASFSPKEVAEFGQNTPMKRPAQPCEIAPAFVFLASSDASYMTGQFIHINGGSYMG
jgi:NAD(P)-dependent dehydrogenase (short-subunit alcohol dehydrogenase family)